MYGHDLLVLITNGVGHEGQIEKNEEQRRGLRGKSSVSSINP